MIQRSFLPVKILSEFIDSIWISKKNDITISLKLLPGTGAEMYFFISGSFIDDKRLLQDKIYFLSLRNKSIDIEIPKNSLFIAVRFKFDSFRHFFDNQIHDMFDKLYPASDIFGKNINNLNTTLDNCIDIEKKVENISNFLTQQLLLNHKPTHISPFEIRKMYEKPYERKVYEIACDNYLSIRQFEKRFKAQTGLSAKQFLSLSRMQKVVKHCLVNHKEEYLPVALEYGYYDQAHFIKEFKFRTQMIPSSFFKDQYFSTHFYNTKKLVSNTFEK